MTAFSQGPFKKTSFWAPRAAFDVVLRPRRWNQVFHTPVAIRFLESDWSQHRTVVRWTYSQESQHKILLLTFSCEYAYQTFFERWRAVSNALGRLIKHHPKINFTDVPVDINDCDNSSVPENTFRFAKLLNDSHDLIPNPYLLEKRKRFLPHTHWKKKRLTLFPRCAYRTIKIFGRPTRGCLSCSKTNPGHRL